MINDNYSLTFSNTYVAFLKYVAYYNLKKLNINGRICYSYVNNQLKTIYNTGNIIFSQDYPSCTSIHIFYQNTIFVFVKVDNTVILTDLCHPYEWHNENTLLGIPFSVMPSIDNLLYHKCYQPYNHRSYTALTTYNAFLSFADDEFKNPDIYLNPSLFQAFDMYYKDCMDYKNINMGDEQPFKYVCINDIIIIYDYVKPSISTKNLIVDDSSDEIFFTLNDLKEWGCFTDEGIYPSFWN